jgi:serine/threonine-protein kinase
MGRVLLVFDRKHHAEKALKILHPEHCDKRWLTARFIREANATKMLDHPGVVKFHGAYNRDGQLFYTMEYVPGKNLRVYLAKAGRLSLGSAVRILCLLARALDYTHRFTIHRDISPENIMVVPDGSVRLIDFGLTRLNNDEENLTIAGTSLGKIEYHAPEQDVDASTVDGRADIYPLGIMLFEMLTGERPDGDLRVTRFRPELPRLCDEVVRLTLARNPDERFHTAHAFHDALLGAYEESKRGPRRRSWFSFEGLGRLLGRVRRRRPR